MKKNKVFIACDSKNINKVKEIIKKTIHFKMSKDLFKKLNNEE